MLIGLLLLTSILATASPATAKGEEEESLWEKKWDQEPSPEYTKQRVENPEDYNIQGLRVNADFKIDLHQWYEDKVEEGTYWVPAAKLGTPDNTTEELKKLVKKPEKARKNIDNLYEALAFIHIMEASFSNGNIVVNDDKGVRWEFPRPARFSIKNNIINCASATNIIKYLLEDNYEEVGFIWRHRAQDAERKGGHGTSYIKHNGEYYFFDPVSLAEEKSKYPVEDGDGHFYHADSCDKIIQSSPKNYAIYWTQMAGSDIGIFSMYTGSHFALGSNGYTFYYPKAFDDSSLKVWKDPADNCELLKADYNPEPPDELKEYEPYKNYLDPNYGVENPNREEGTIPTDDQRISEPYDLSVSIVPEGFGSVSIIPNKDEYEKGEEVSLVATFNDTYYFEGWTGDYKGTDTEITITMDRDKTITANFEIKKESVNTESSVDERIVQNKLSLNKIPNNIGNVIVGKAGAERVEATFTQDTISIKGNTYQSTWEEEDYCLIQIENNEVTIVGTHRYGTMAGTIYYRENQPLETTLIKWEDENDDEEPQMSEIFSKEIE